MALDPELDRVAAQAAADARERRSAADAGELPADCPVSPPAQGDSALLRQGPAPRPAWLRPGVSCQARRMTATLPAGPWQGPAGMQMRAMVQAMQQAQDTAVEQGFESGPGVETPDGSPAVPGTALPGTATVDADTADVARPDAGSDRQQPSNDACPAAAGERWAAAPGAPDDTSSQEQDHEGDSQTGGEDPGHAARAGARSGNRPSPVDAVNSDIEQLPEIASADELIDAVLSHLHARSGPPRLVLLGHAHAESLEDTPSGLVLAMAGLHALGPDTRPRCLLLQASPHDERQLAEGRAGRFARQRGFDVHGHDLFGQVDPAVPAYRSDLREHAMRLAVEQALHEHHAVVASACSVHIAGLHDALSGEHETACLAIVSCLGAGELHAAHRIRRLLSSPGVAAFRVGAALERDPACLADRVEQRLAARSAD